MADILNNVRITVVQRVELFINETIPQLRAHIAQGGHTVMHLQDIINNLIVLNEDTANPQDWPLDILRLRFRWSSEQQHWSVVA